MPENNNNQNLLTQVISTRSPAEGPGLIEFGAGPLSGNVIKLRNFTPWRIRNKDANCFLCDFAPLFLCAKYYIIYIIS